MMEKTEQINKQTILMIIICIDSNKNAIEESSSC